jgi:hypothetical protein
MNKNLELRHLAYTRCLFHKFHVFQTRGKEYSKIDAKTNPKPTSKLPKTRRKTHNEKQLISFGDHDVMMMTIMMMRMMTMMMTMVIRMMMMILI